MKLITSKICMTKDVGLNGNLFGGNMMAWADEASAIFAREECSWDLMVTRHVSEIDFTKAVKVGTILKFYAIDKEFGETSIKFTLFVVDPQGNEYFRTKFVFVSIDEEGKRIKLPCLAKTRKFFKHLKNSEIFTNRPEEQDNDTRKSK